MRECDLTEINVLYKYILNLYSSNFNYSRNENLNELWSNLESGLLNNPCNHDLEKLEDGSLYNNSTIVRESKSRKKTQECVKEIELDIV